MSELIELKELSTKYLNRKTPKSFYQPKPKCVFCPKLFSFIDTAIMVNRALYLKYSAS